MSADQWALRCMTLGGTCPPLGGLEAYLTWLLKSSAKRYYRGRSCVFLALDVCGLQGFGDNSKVGLLEFLELWLRTYPLSCGSG